MANGYKDGGRVGVSMGGTTKRRKKYKKNNNLTIPKRDCHKCKYYVNEVCMAFPQAFTPTSSSLAEKCKKYTSYNEAENKKIQELKKNKEEKNACRFVTISALIWSGRREYTHKAGNEIINGLQINNTIYTVNGNKKMATAQNTQIIKVYNAVPKWATKELKDKYYNELRKRKGE